MSKTLATRKQSEAIRARMQQIRNDLPYDVDDARKQVRQLTDWRYQFRKHPAAIMAASAIVGYLLVPHVRKQPKIIVQSSDGEHVRPTKPARKGLVGGLVAAAATMALKSGTSMLTQHLSSTLLGQTRSTRPTSSTGVTPSEYSSVKSSSSSGVAS